MALKSALWLAICCFSSVLPAVAAQSTTPYAPYTVACPRERLVRGAKRLNRQEDEYVGRRKPRADAALVDWLKKTWQSKTDLDSCDLPKIAVALSGGGVKASIVTAGVVHSLDSRDSSTAVSGLLQSTTYVSGLSGGSLTVGGVFANNFSPVSPLKTNLWDLTYPNPFSVPLANFASLVCDPHLAQSIHD